MTIEVRKPGLSTTVQDTGRSGYYDLGIPPSGGLDQFSLRAANLLVGNPEGAAVLEIVYLGPELVFTDAAVVAVAGAAMTPKVNGEERPQWESFAVAAGDVLTFGYLAGGARAYLAVSGGVDVPEVLGSRSTYGLGALGGFQGRPLAAGILGLILGVLLMGHAKGAYWYGSRLTIDQARELVPHNNATSLQVTAAVLAGLVWAMENPRAGILEADQIDHARCMEVMRPYLGEVVGVYSDWTPLKDRGFPFPEELDESDPWQFSNIRVT